MSDRGLPAGRFLSHDECVALANRAIHFAIGGGETSLHLNTSWTGNIRWARNEIASSGDVRDNQIGVRRSVRGAGAMVNTNQIDDTNIQAALRRAERLVIQSGESPEESFYQPYIEPYPEPHLWSDATYGLSAEARADTMRALVKPAQEAGMLSAGYIEVAGQAQGIMNYAGRSIYHPYTLAQYSVTVRDPMGVGSGWAGVDHTDWDRIDATALSATALEKCLTSRNPVALEPGRYETILEPQAVSDLVEPLLSNAMDRFGAENWPPRGPFSGAQRGMSRIGELVIDERVTISVDPADANAGFLPIDVGGTVYHAVDWIEKGVLRELSYARDPYGIQSLGKNTGLPNNAAFTMTGGVTTIPEMIATTKRGVLVTRFWGVQTIDFPSMLLTGYTRDGTWLIEDGRIAHPIKNFRFTDSPLFALNKIEALGVPKRVYRPGAPTIVPSLKVRDFSFTALSDAV